MLRGQKHELLSHCYNVTCFVYKAQVDRSPPGNRIPADRGYHLVRWGWVYWLPRHSSTSLRMYLKEKDREVVGRVVRLSVPLALFDPNESGSIARKQGGERGLFQLLMDLI